MGSEQQRLDREFCEAILKEKKMSLSCQTTMLCFFNTFAGARASPTVLLDIADDGPDDPPTVQDEAPCAIQM
jgi:hypothetical protein